MWKRIFWFCFVVSGLAVCVGFALPWVHIDSQIQEKGQKLLEGLGGNIVIQFEQAEQKHQLDLASLFEGPIQLRGYEIPIFMQRDEVQGSLGLAQWYGIQDAKTWIRRSQWLWGVPAVVILAFIVNGLLGRVLWLRGGVALVLMILGTVSILEVRGFILDQPEPFLRIEMGVWISGVALIAMGICLVGTLCMRLVDTKRSACL